MKSVNQVEDRLLAEAKQLATPGQRRAFLQTACGENLQLRQRLEAALGDLGQAAETEDSCAVVSTCSNASDPARPVATRQSGDRIGHYLVIRRQAAGGMGEVYLAQDTRLGRLVALKFLPEEAARDAARRLRFFSEARAAAALNHPNICTVYDVAETDDALPYIAMEWLEGPTLRERLTGAPLPMAELLQIGLQVTEALDAAHARGIVHRDLKPANVSLMPGGLVKVLDFGLAKWQQELALADDARPAASLAESGQDVDTGATTASQTAAGQIMGSLGHMSPEQAAGNPVDHRSDLFSLGVILYEMATGRLPFAAGSRAEILQRTIAGEPESLAWFNDQVPAELERIVIKCLQKDLRERYQSAKELHADLLNLRARLAAPGNAVSGQVVVLLCLEFAEAVRLKQSGRLQEAAELMRQQEARFQKLVNGQGRVETVGDAFLMEFARVSEAVQAALRAVSENGMACRLGLHLGEVLEASPAEPLRRHGVHLETALRLTQLAEPGRALMSRGVFDSARVVIKRVDVSGLGALSWVSHGQYAFEGLEEPLEVCEVSFAGRPAPSPPPTTEKARRLSAAEGDTVLGWRPAVGQEVPNTKWVLEEKLGEGGFGEVWKARHEKQEESRVFKFCFRADRVRSLKREVTLFRVLKERIGDHPHIVKLHDTYFDQPPFYLEEEYVEGRDLRSWCEAQGGVEKVPLGVRLEIVAQAADALQAAHDAGVIHRDVKPGNILISGRWPEVNHQPSTINHQPLVKLTDFGIGQVTSAEVLKEITCAGFTQTLMSPSSSYAGTQLYMAPELLAGKQASTRSDIYSLGVVLYQLLVGDLRRPLTADWQRQITDPLFREDLEGCFAGNPEDRLAGPSELARHLRRIDERRSESHKRSRATARLKLLKQTVIVAAASVAVVSVGLLYQANQAQRFKRLAEENRRNLYAADMNVVQKALDEGNLLDAQRILKRHLPIAGAPDLRGFEWRYFWKQARGEQAHTIATRYPLKHLSLSPDGRVLAAGLLRAGGVILYDAITRKELARLPTAGKTTLSLAFSSDSRLLAVGSDDIESLSGTENGRAEVWDVERSQRVAVLKIRAPFVAFWPGDSKIIVGSGSSFAPDSQSIQLWAYRSPAEATVVLSTNEYRPELSPDGRWMATASTREIVLWDVASLRRLREFACEQEVRSLRFSPDGRLLATGQSQGKVYLWDVSTGSHIGTFVGHTGGADGLAFSTDGALLATGSHDHTLRLWDVSSQRQVRLFGAVGTLCDVCYSKASEELITASYTGQIDFWKTSPTNSLDGMKTTQLRISFSADGNLILGKHQDERITIYSTESGRIIAEILDTFSPIGFLPGGLSFVSWGRLPDRSMAARIWNLGESTPRREVVLGQSAGSPRHPCKALSIDGEILAAGDSAGRVRIWRLRTGQLLQEFQAHKQEILALEVSPDGKFLATASHDVTATLWSIPEWRETIRLKIENRVSDFAFSPRGDILATGHVSQSINLWDTASGRRLAELKGHKGSSQSVSISPDGRTLASASPDMTIRLWNLSTLRQVALFAHPIRWGPATIRFSPDGGGLAIFDGQSELRILRAPTLAEIHGNM